MKNTKKLLLTGLAALSLTACFGSEEDRSKDWYITHSAEQAIQFDICKNRPALSETPNCIAAKEAEAILSQDYEAIQAYIKSNGLDNSQLK